MAPPPASAGDDENRRTGLRSYSRGDRIFKGVTMLFALSILAIAMAIAYQLIVNSSLARKAFGWAFLHKQIWDPVAEDFGALPFI
jgi:phosphate transport system permease protein